MIKNLSVLLLAASLSALPARAQERISHGSFDRVALYRPQGEAGQFVLFLSGDSGWDGTMDTAARALVKEGAMVAGIDMPRLRAALGKDGDDCVLPDGDLENLSHYLQGYARQPTYRTPLLVGYGSGAALAYAMQAVADQDTFAGAISLSFCPRLDLGKPLCPSADKRFLKEAKGKVSVLAPVSELPQPWVALQASNDGRCAVADVRDFVGGIRGAALSTLPGRGPNLWTDKGTLPALLASYRVLTAGRDIALPPPPAKLIDLPLIEVPADGDSDTFAILLSGDGGWAGLDKEVAKSLVAKGIPVVGFDSLRYFWKAREPEELATDVDRIVRHYAKHWRKKRVVLIGYSQGADVLPFAVNRLPASSRALVAQTVLMGLGQNASFEFHLSNWVGNDDGLPILPEAIKLSDADTLCLYGEDEDDSLCPDIPPGHVHAQSLAGGHHFDGAYDKLAELIVQRIAEP
ncbi:AcvB/VirJ family lysyl-phosphatidylglycerol hydrolase [Pseudoxanthomonas sacheonensis]|uniref:Type IV secretory pathway VirJ component n=1 Tax=Pseudoxanthomonas sacheonensis TaxID=443615 RepID=A0ABU1RMF0_9GAMM|nr:AcvB/VirJ family lysyl-phosphatidylglycerol hydrolase [Pseudoxanthomonas sacheonensis]MDR6839787.1 type IV secretory pathway VirJ component [Pseudoxanthomonas sacheonensis]